MLSIALILSSFPWFPSALSIGALCVLGLSALWSRAYVMAGIVALLAIHELHIQQRMQSVIPEDASAEVCQAKLHIETVLTQTPQYRSASVRYHKGDCDALVPGDRLKLTISGFHAITTNAVLTAQIKVKPLHGFQNPSGFDAKRHGLARGWVAQAQAKQILKQTAPHGLRHQLYAQIEAWPDPLRGLGLALLFGEKHAMDATMHAVFTQLGLAHVLSVSGLHVGIVLAALWWTAGLGLRHQTPAVRVRTRALLVSVAAWLLCDWTLWSPSVTRAASMATVMAWLPVFGIRLRLLSLLSVAVMGIALLDPLISLSTGFLMSAGALALIGIVMWANPSLGIVQVLRLQFVFSYLMAPMLSWWLGFDFPWLGIIANIVLVPLLPIIICVLFGLMWIDQADWIGVINDWVAEAVTAVHWLLAQTLFAQAPDWTVLALLMVVSLWVCLPRFWPRRTLISCGVFCVLLPIETKPVFQMLDVGQGSLAVLETQNHRVVFDLGAGMPDRWSRIGQLHAASQFDGIQGVHISHGDMDHIGGLFDVLNQPLVPEWIEGGGSVATMARPCTDRRVVGSVTIETLWPREHREGSENHLSCVQLISAFDTRILLMGDADWVAESFVIRALHVRDLLGKIDVVVTSHHGARDGSNPSFVALTGAQHALISVGASNRYGHPHEEVVHRWRAAGSIVHRTDQHGAIRVDLESGAVSRYRAQFPRRWTG
jgi:competence protein ComEC